MSAEFVLKTVRPVEPFKFVLMLLNEKWQPIHYAAEAFPTKEEALARAKFLVEHGSNVVVYREIAFCETAARAEER